MKLTKQKLEQLIMEEYVRRIGDERKPTKYPEHENKLTTLAKSDPLQAAALADSLDEPLNIEFDPSNMDYFPIDSEFGKHLNSPDFWLHYDFYTDDRVSSLEEEPDIGEIYEYAQENGLDPEETRDKIMKSFQILIRGKYLRKDPFATSTNKRVPDTWFDRESKFY